MKTICKVSQETIKLFLDLWQREHDLAGRVLIYSESDDGCFVAVDNSTGDCWTEDFRTEDEAINWLLEE